MATSVRKISQSLIGSPSPKIDKIINNLNDTDDSVMITSDDSVEITLTDTDIVKNIELIELVTQQPTSTSVDPSITKFSGQQLNIN